jgi:hypothetical protein
MAVYHVLKDGSRPKDITGHVVRMDDAEPLYRLLDSFSQKIKAKKSNTYEQKKNEA